MSHLCICGHVRQEHQRTQPYPGFDDFGHCQAKGCRCLYFEPKDWLEQQDKESANESDDADGEDE